MQSIPSDRVSVGVLVILREQEVGGHGGLDVDLDVVPHHHRPHEARELYQHHQDYQDSRLEWWKITF